MRLANPTYLFSCFHTRRLVAIGLLLAIPGCVLTPRGTEEEQAKATAAGKPFEPEVENRYVPELPAEPTWRDLLQHAFLTNGELEAAYFEWKAALARIPQAAGYPNTNLAPSFSYLFSGSRMKSWDRTTINTGFDPMQNLSLPVKVAQAGKVAFDDARAAGERFRTAKFSLQQKVLTSYFDMVLMDEKIRIATDNVALLKLVSDTAGDRVRAGGSQQEQLKSQTDYRLAENELASMRSQHMSMIALLNAIIGEPPGAPLHHPTGIPSARKIPANDGQLIAIATENNADLARLARETQGREDALELAKLNYLPDINPSFAFTGSVSQSLGAMVILPTTIPQIRGKIDEARAMLRASEAMQRQTKADKAASFIAALYILRNSERQADLFEHTILPRAQEALTNSRQSYATGAGGFVDLIDSQRTLLEVRQTIAETRIEREKRLAELEAIACVDIETLATGSVTTLPADTPARHEADGGTAS